MKTLEIAEGKILCHVINSSGENDTIPLEKQLLIECNILNNVISLDLPGEAEKKECDWSDESIRMVLDKYDEHIAELGPMKRFEIKKKMWEQIASDLNDTFLLSKSAQQVENRFKTILKRKKNAVDNNTKSGAKHQKIEFQEELGRITGKDDSMEPEIMQD